MTTKRFKHWLSYSGVLLAVLLLAAGVIAGLLVDEPTQLPGVALESPLVYRLEVAGLIVLIPTIGLTVVARLAARDLPSELSLGGTGLKWTTAVERNSHTIEDLSQLLENAVQANDALVVKISDLEARIEELEVLKPVPAADTSEGEHDV